MAEEGEGVSLPETNKREQSTETKEAVENCETKEETSWNGIIGGILENGRIYKNRFKEQMIPIYMFFFLGEENSSNDVGRNTDGCDMRV